MTYLDLFVICWILCPAVSCGVIAALTTSQAGVFIEDLLPTTQAPREILRVATGPAPGVRFLLIIIIIVVHLGGSRRRDIRTWPNTPRTPTPLRKGKREGRKVAQGGGWDDLLIILVVIVVLIKGEAPLLEADGRREGADKSPWDEEAFDEKWAQALENTGFLTPEIMRLEPVVESRAGICEFEAEEIEEMLGAPPKRKRQKWRKGGRHGGKSRRHGGRRMKDTWVR